MRFYNKQHNYYCGIDLHADAMYLCVLDATGETVLHKNIPTKPKSFLRLIKPYRSELVVGCECMFTWYWLADLCADEKIDFVLGHALYMEPSTAARPRTTRSILTRLPSYFAVVLSLYPTFIRKRCEQRAICFADVTILHVNEPNFTHISKTPPPSTICRLLGGLPSRVNVVTFCKSLTTRSCA